MDKSVVLNKDEREILIEYLHEKLDTDIHYLSDDGMNKLNKEEMMDYLDEIHKLVHICQSLIESNDEIVIVDSDTVNKLCLDIDFGIFEVIRHDEDIDSPIWLYRLMCVWKKFAEASKFYDNIKL